MVTQYRTVETTRFQGQRPAGPSEGGGEGGSASTQTRPRLANTRCECPPAIHLCPVFPKARAGFLSCSTVTLNCDCREEETQAVTSGFWVSMEKNATVGFYLPFA